MPSSRLAAIVLALLVAPLARAQVQSGSIQGRVTDATTGAGLPLVTVVASAPTLQGTLNEFTDGAGQFYLSSLPPGTYSLLFIFGGAQVKRENVEVGVGRATLVNARIDPQAGEPVTILEKAPAIDAGSTKQGTTLRRDYLRNVPIRGRTWQAAVGSAAGAQDDAYGPGFSGSTSVENHYVVDGLNTSGVALGNAQGGQTQGASVLNNFIQEIEVITGGYNAEFGRSTGGVVNVVTKSGSNEIRGSVFANVQALNARSAPVPEEGSAIRADEQLPTSIDFGFELGGPIIEDRLWFFVGFAPVIDRTQVSRIVRTRVDRARADFDYARPGCATNLDGTCDSDGNPATSPRARCELEVLADGRNACEGDDIPDTDANGLTIFEEIDRADKTQTVSAYHFTAKLDLALAPEHRGQLSLTGTPVVGSNIVGTVYGTPTRGERNEVELTSDATLKWTSKFAGNKTQVDALVGWHRFARETESIHPRIPGTGGLTAETPRLTIIDQTAVLPSDDSRFFNTLEAVANNDDVPESDRVRMFCQDGATTPGDAWKGIKNCPIGVNGYGMYSPGRYMDTTEQRFAGKLSVTQRVKAAGHHAFKGGVEVESLLLENDRTLTGGVDIHNAAGSRWNFFRYVSLGGDEYCSQINRPIGQFSEHACTYRDRYYVTGNTLNLGAFLQDSWSILPNLTVNAGLRYEQQYLRYSNTTKNVIDPITMQRVGRNALELTDLFAPRAGVIYDWTREGRSKLYASWGRFYNNIPMNMNDRSFGGEIQYYERWGYARNGPCGTNTNPSFPSFPTLPQTCPRGDFGPTGGPVLDPAENPSAPDRSILIGLADPAYGIPAGVALVMPGTSAQHLDELVIGVEYEPLEDLRVGLSFQNRRLGRVVEDISTDGGSTYFFGNPGEFDADAEAELLGQIGRFGMEDPRRAQLIARLEAFRKTRRYDDPRRNYNALQLVAAKRFSRAFMMQGSYTVSILEGNYAGLFSPDTGQLDPNITSMWDLFELMPNRTGRLPFDRPHAFKIDGYYKFDLGRSGEVTTGARLRAQSGVPITPLGAHWIYGDRESFLNPRGSYGRTDFETNVDLHVAYARRLGDMGLEVFLEVFNVFNHQGEVSVDQEYTSGEADPIVGGDFKDLYYLKTSNIHAILDGDGDGRPDGFARPLPRNLNFGNTDARQAPLSARVGLTLSF
jgi:outer membrane receptor protein involved in Fe transport